MSGKCFDSTWLRTLAFHWWLNPLQMLQKCLLEWWSLDTYWSNSDGSCIRPGTEVIVKCLSMFSVLLLSMFCQSLIASTSFRTLFTTIDECFWKMFGLHMITNIRSGWVTKSFTNAAEVFIGMWILWNILK